MSHGASNTPPPDPVAVLGGGSAVSSVLWIDHHTFITGHTDGQIQEWSVPTRRAVTAWAGHNDTVLWLDNVQDQLLSQGRDELVKLWSKLDGQSNTWIVTGQIPSAPHIFCNSAIIHSSVNLMIAVPCDQTSYINCHMLTPLSSSSPSSLQSQGTIKISEQPVQILRPSQVKEYGMCMKMSEIELQHNNNNNHDKNNTGYLLVGYESGSVALWDVKNAEILHSIKLHEDSVMCLTTWSNQETGQFIGFSGSVNNTIKSWSILKDNFIQSNHSVTSTNEGFNGVSVRKDGRIVATGGWDGNGRVFSVKKLRPLAVLTYHKQSVSCVSFGPDDTLLIGSKDGYITLWDVYKNKL